VRVDQLSGEQVRVTIRTRGETYFGKVVLSDVEIERYASADYNLPVPMGSPYNILGYGVSFGGEPASNVLLVLEGYCNNPKNGDRRGNVYLNNSSCTGDDADTNFAAGLARTATGSSVRHPLFADPASGGLSEGRKGYRFVIEVPPSTGPTSVWIFDAPACNRSGVRNVNDGAGSGSSTVRLEFSMFDATLTPLDDSDITPLPMSGSPPNGTVTPTATRVSWVPAQPADNTAQGNGCDSWLQVPLTSTLSPGRYYLDVRNDETYRGGFSSGTNFFAIQARENGATTVYDSRTDPSSPQVYAQKWLPVRAALPSGAGLSAIFQLAEIDDAVHNGKTLEIAMYDPGEGMRLIEILDPGGNPLWFEWDTDDSPTLNYNGQRHVANATGDPFTPTGFQPATECGGRCLDATANRPVLWQLWDNPASSGWSTSSRFQGRELYIRVPLGVGSNAGLDWNDHWFEVRYTCVDGNGNGECDSVSDVTTWRVRVIGDPVRLTE
jgi:hypothetical protein